MTDPSTSHAEYQSVVSLGDCVKESETTPIVLFKHSSICPTSHYAKREVDSFLPESTVPVYLIVVQENRPLSAEIAEALATKHESPQALVVLKGEVKNVMNHSGITKNAISAALAAL